MGRVQIEWGVPVLCKFRNEASFVLDLFTAEAKNASSTGSPRGAPPQPPSLAGPPPPDNAFIVRATLPEKLVDFWAVQVLLLWRLELLGLVIDEVTYAFFAHGSHVKY